ncbi:MAG: zf-TFIIB domain-containing protein [Elusimicrobia bacterium]|nr:zf-TFIIB domain-containing protein [Elusimicrobiota bacterium]
MTEASVLRCPSCGGPTEPKAEACPYCKVTLNPVRCPWCFVWSYSECGCPHCGATGLPPGPDAPPLSCPTCRQGALTSRVLGAARLSGCSRCGGVWVDPSSFQRICADRQTQAAYLGEGSVTPAPKPSDPTDSSLRYRPCAQCGDLMNRINFAGRSGVILDVCKPHGIWFDPDELRRIVEFIRGGGLDLARQREKDELTAERRRLEQERRAPPLISPAVSFAGATIPEGLSTARFLLKLIFDLPSGR